MGPARHAPLGNDNLNPGPLAPQATNINHLQSILTENKRFTPRRFGRHLDAKTPNRAVWTPRGLHGLAGRVSQESPLPKRTVERS